MDLPPESTRLLYMQLPDRPGDLRRAWVAAMKQPAKLTPFRAGMARLSKGTQAALKEKRGSETPMISTPMPTPLRLRYMFRRTRKPFHVILVGILISLSSARAAVTTGTDDEAQLPYWEIAQGHISVRLIQRLPDQTRGFFEARGFSTADADRIAQSCVFQTIFKNVAPTGHKGAIDYNLKEWVVQVGGKTRQLKTREDWQKEWTTRGVPPPAQLAFEWTLIPTRQRYAAGDYNWGFSIFDLAPGTRFDLDFVWRENGARRRGRIDGIVCAPDVEVPPAAQ